MFLKNKNIIFKIRRSKVKDYAALIDGPIIFFNYTNFTNFSAKYLLMCKVHIDVGGIK